MADILIYTPDGRKRYVALESECVTLGRSPAADLSFSEDSGLSRLHLAFERTSSGFLVRDLKSKNGTVVNGSRIEGPRQLKPNDKLSCGHLLIVFAPPQQRSEAAVTFVDDTTQSESATIVTSLGGLMKDAAKDSGGAQISALIRAGNELASERPLPELFRIILDLSLEAVCARRGVLMTMENGQLLERAMRGDNFKISSAVRDHVIEGKLSMLVRDTSADAAFRERESIIAAQVSSLMAVPLQARDVVTGLIYVDSPSALRGFTRDDLNLLTVMANVAAIRVEHARLSEVEQARKVMEHELEQAQAIQRAALPAAAPRVPGLDLAGHSAPALSVGGDYYDFFTDSGGQAAMLVADVSGKGMPAALMAMALQARVQSLFETLPLETGGLSTVMARLNRLTSANCPRGRFITAFVCVADGQTGKLDWACAGHNPPLIVRADGSCEVLSGGDPILGFFANRPFHQFEAHLNPGDLIAIYSDGVTEACSPGNEDFDIPGLADVLTVNRVLPAAELIQAVMNRLQEWTVGAPQADDITLLIAKKT